METLPIEMVGEICSFLKPQELAACCAVSILWRKVFNSDFLWQQRCRPDLGNYLETAKCKVEPKFVSPVSEGSSLSPVGQWRMSFMRENHLWNNWRTGKGVKSKFTRLNKGSDVGCFVTDDIVLFMNFGMGTQLWDVSTKPFTVIGEPFSLLQDFDYDNQDFELFCARFGCNSMIIRQASLVMIYDISTPVNADWKLRHAFECQGDKKFGISEAEEYAENYDRNDFGDIYDSVVVGNKFIAIVDGSEGPAIHIWDAENGVKLKEDSFPEEAKKAKRCGIKCDENSMPFCLVFIFDEVGETVLFNFFLYNLDTFNFLPFTQNTQVSHKYVFHDIICPAVLVKKLFVLFNKNYLEIYNFTTSDLLFRFSAKYMYPKLCDNRIYFVSKKQVKVFNTSTLKVENLPPFEANNGVLSIENICDKFFYVKKINNVKEVWESHKLLVNSNTLSKITVTKAIREMKALNDQFNDVDIHESCSRVLVYRHYVTDRCYIVDFW